MKRDGRTQWQKCQEYWLKARQEAGRLGFINEFERQSAIIILKKRFKDLLRTSETICYNPTFLTQRGWCEIKGSTEKERRWGVCSTSCEQYYRYRGTPIEPPVYHEMKLRLIIVAKDSQKMNSRSFSNKALVLSKPIYHKHKIWTFERSVRIPGRQESQDTFNSKGGMNVDVEPIRKEKERGKYTYFGNELSISTSFMIFVSILKHCHIHMIATSIKALLVFSIWRLRCRCADMGRRDDQERSNTKARNKNIHTYCDKRRKIQGR